MGGLLFSLGKILRSGSVAAVVCLALSPAVAWASPWAEVGDSQLRSDIEILAAAGLVDDVTTQWPLPWPGIVNALRTDALSRQPAYVRAAALRVLVEAKEAMRRDGVQVSATLDVTNNPSPVYGFDGMGREKGQGQLSAEINFPDTALRISLGSQIDAHGRASIVPDGSYIAQKVGGALVYAGYLTHWWGPGWISALSLSNNARPFPQVGIERLSTSAFESPFLSWLGPWQAEFFVGWLNDKRIAMNTLYNGLRFTVNPLPGLELGFARTEEFCGEGHPCQPFKDYFELANNNTHVDRTNDEGLVDARYTNNIDGTPFEIYLQLMNEDSNPISHSITSHLFGASVWLPLTENPLRLTLEYTDSVPTVDIFSFGDVLHGGAYNNSGYPDGMRYRGRSLGFSLDSDSRLLSLQASWLDDAGRTYTLSVHHAQVSDAQDTFNVATTAPVHINMGEARVNLPFKGFSLDLAARLQDDQLRPKHGFGGALEAAVKVGL